GPSLEISGSLLAMYDSLASRTRAEHQSAQPQQQPQQSQQQQGQRPAFSCQGTPLKRSHTHPSPLREQQLRGGRPLSSSSECSSSSSSSSSSSLPRGLDVKKSYLASIESLEDDDPGPGCRGVSGRNPASSATAQLSCRVRSSGPCTHRGGSGSQPSAEEAAGAPGSDGRVPGPSYLDRVLQEVVDTERTYVRDLAAIVQGYLKPMSEVPDGKISQSDLSNLFGNIEDIYSFNSTFLEQLEICGSNPVSIARCFVANSDGFSVYSEFCTNYPRTVSVLTDLVRKTETAEVFKARQISLHHSLPLGSYLLKPVQRILKYHLFLQNIVKHLDKESEGYPDVKNALSVMTGIAFHINDMKRRHEHAVRVQEIQSLLYGWQGKDLTTYGELVAEGSFRMLGAKALRHLFLFDKVLLIAKKREEGILNHKTHITCSNLMLIESIQGEPLCFQVVPFNSPCNQYSFQARSLDQKREWCLQLKRAIMESFSAVIPNHAKQLVLELGQTKSQKELSCDKSSVRKSLSAPEYLKKRRYDRRKSETSLQKAFRLRRGEPKIMKQILEFARVHLDERPASFLSLQCVCSCQASICAGPSNRLLPMNSAPTTPLLSSSACSSNGPSFPRSPDMWRRWDPGDTSDTENEDNPYAALDVRRLLRYRPPAPNTRTKSCTTEDSSGEYVTFEFANNHARRDLSTTYGSEGSLSNCCSTDGPDYASLWARLGNTARKAPEETGSKPAVRRTQSFTEMARTKVSSLLPKRAGMVPALPELHGSLSELAVNEGRNPTVAAAWLDRLGDHLPTGGCNRCGSLPRSFQLVPDAPQELSKTQQLRTRAEHLRLQHPEQRPFTIASDKPGKVDFLDDPERYQEMAQLRARRQLRDGQETATGCSTTPAVSVESVSSSPIHPEHKIYRQDEGRSWRSVLSGFGSRFSQLRSSLSPSHEDSSVSAESAEDKKQRMMPSSREGGLRLERFPSRESVRTVDSRTSQSKKILTSLSKAYASVVHLRSAKPPDPASPRLHRIHGSSAAAARIAQQTEPDYFAPKTILALLSKDTRPDSVLSGSSNRTSSSSSDNDKLAEATRTLTIHEAFLDLGDDAESDDSDASADSYYERTFEAIENVLAEEMFRDSAIYSDPEDADASATEYNFEQPVVSEPSTRTVRGVEPYPLSTLCVRKVKGTIVEKLRVLQENSKFKTDELTKPAVQGFKSIQQRRLELEQWRRQQGEEDEGQAVPHQDGQSSTDASSQSKGWVKHLVDRFQTGT
ncbi:unnamed protein product, partial [Ixodes hexagonus]